MSVAIGIAIDKALNGTDKNDVIFRTVGCVINAPYTTGHNNPR
ncbi:hypothetical protein [Chroococcidiopsis sp.]